MDKKKLKTYQERLIAERNSLLGVVGRTEDYGREADIEATQDPADKASNSYTKELLFSQSTNDVCTNCGNEIGAKRLEALPWVRYCINCQEMAEKGLLDEEE